MIYLIYVIIGPLNNFLDVFFLHCVKANTRWIFSLIFQFSVKRCKRRIEFQKPNFTLGGKGLKGNWIPMPGWSFEHEPSCNRRILRDFRRKDNLSSRKLAQKPHEVVTFFSLAIGHSFSRIGF
jgi:hypothetical protein